MAVLLKDVAFCNALVPIAKEPVLECPAFNPIAKDL